MKSEHSTPTKWEALCTIFDAELSKVKDDLTAISQKLNLPPDSPVWDQIILAFSKRKRNNAPALKTLAELKALNDKYSKANKHSLAMIDLTDGLRKLQGRFIAIVSGQNFPARSYHFYGHAKEMSEDPGEFIRTIAGADDLGHLLVQITNALGAAHDIIQTSGAPLNEIKSAEIFINETQLMIRELLKNSDYSPRTKKILEDFSQNTIPFLAEECIVNSTYFLFNSGKRDFDNILTQINQIFVKAKSKNIGAMTLPKEILAMKMSMSLADTRRSQMKFVLRKLEAYNFIVKANKPALEKLLRAAKILNPDQSLPDLESEKASDDVLRKLMQVEGFLLRLGQNIRINSELAFAKNPERKQLIKQLRMNQPVQIEIDKHVDPFLMALHPENPYGEIAFATALGDIDHLELNDNVKLNNLENMVNKDTFDVGGMRRHAKNLTDLKEGIEKLNDEEKKEIGELIYLIAAKSPGHKVGPAIFHAMMEYKKEQISHANFLPQLDVELEEIMVANPKLIERSPMLSSLPTPIHSRNSSLTLPVTRGRFYSEPHISFSSTRSSTEDKFSEPRSPKSGKSDKLPELTSKTIPEEGKSSPTEEQAPNKVKKFAFPQLTFGEPKPQRSSSIQAKRGKLPPIIHPAKTSTTKTPRKK